MKLMDTLKSTLTWGQTVLPKVERLSMISDAEERTGLLADIAAELARVRGAPVTREEHAARVGEWIRECAALFATPVSGADLPCRCGHAPGLSRTPRTDGAARGAARRVAGALLGSLVRCSRRRYRRRWPRCRAASTRYRRGDVPSGSRSWSDGGPTSSRSTSASSTRCTRTVAGPSPPSTWWSRRIGAQRSGARWNWPRRARPTGPRVRPRSISRTRRAGAHAQSEYLANTHTGERA